MPRRRNGASSGGQSYHPQLRQAMSQFLPHQGLPLLSGDGRVRWTSRLLAMVAIFMVWSPCRTLIDRLANARDTVVGIYPTRRRPGRSHEGFSKALARHGAVILAALADHWRSCVRELASGFWKEYGWVLFGVDGSIFDCPRTAANEQAFGSSGRRNGGPQQLVTCLFHVTSGLIWCWRRGGVKENSERRQLRQMLHLLPPNAMVLADAGFHGYDLSRLLLRQGSSFLMRVGNNVSLITQLGYAVREWKDTVYLWPPQQRKRAGCKGPIGKHLDGVRPPLVLRLIRLKDAKGRPICLLTNVLEKSRLSNAAAARMYRLRWGIEVMWRGLKQTMGHHKMLSGTPERAASELDWAMAGLWMLQLISVRRMVESGRLPRRYSPASSLRVLRQAMNGRRHERRSLKIQLNEAVMDEYQRCRSKKARNNMHKRPQHPPGEPVARMATRAERRLAQRILDHPPPNSLAA
jgi:Transposase DDE domain